MRLPWKNHTVFAGVIVSKPELRYLADETPVVSLRLVTKRSYKDPTAPNGWKQLEEFATVVFYRKAATDFMEIDPQINDFVHVEGYRHTRSTGGTGNTRRVAHEIVVTEWHMVTLPKKTSAQASVGILSPAASAVEDDHDSWVRLA